ncbi:hypothetical protein NCER_101745 [Vairimorpha ceranae BRL01]|uniref:Uncharacterized protein n=2 Tax=Vairimorpha ceranae TaxID=40302 RepID=C4VAN7_VAIC1|nr:hypothetical protein AAJ76_3600038661 [Vairimorpha ceranae]EEQ81716.1 hypothetical protein NCER_101745 [Vairimorpha ceranae BRL01]KAF5139812.1 hypothetical protein G9O61_00g019820 [Vairimorpha ceranae]KKO75017.1 hypothetical protein AAJ76_3600038661 [Vairimorpha ceranae]
MIKKDTRFVDLPQNVKQKLINIHRLSHQVYITPEKMSIPSSTELYTQIINLQTSSLQKNLNSISNNFNILKELPGKVDMSYVEAQLRDNIANLKNEVKTYKEIDRNVDFCGVLETTFKILNKRYDAVNKKI